MADPVDMDLLNLLGMTKHELSEVSKNMIEGDKPDRINMRDFIPNRQNPNGVRPIQSTAGFMEPPRATYSGGEPAVGFERSLPTMIPIPEDLQPMVADMLKHPEPIALQPLSVPPATSTPQQTQVPAIPDKFDFDLFQFAVLKDISCNIERVMLEIDKCKTFLEARKKQIDTVLSKSNLGKK